MFLSGCLLMQATCGKGFRPLYKFTSLFRNTTSKNYTDRIKFDKTSHSSIKKEYIFLTLIIQIHILSQTHTQVLVSSSLLLWLVLTGLDPAAPCMLAATSTACFHSVPGSSTITRREKKILAHVPACICVFSHTYARPDNIDREKYLISYFMLCQKSGNRWTDVSLLYFQ